MKSTKWIPLPLILCILTSANALSPGGLEESPVATVRKIGDKLIRTTPFAWQLALPSKSGLFDGLKFVDFARTFDSGRPATAYAYTRIVSARDTVIRVEIEHSDACRIWCNRETVYEKTGEREVEIIRGERGIELSMSFDLPLKNDTNDIVVRSTTSGGDWSVFLQPPCDNDAVLAVMPEYLTMGLKGVENVDENIAELTDWLVLGPFPPAAEAPPGPGNELVFGRMYPGLDGPVTWTIPKIEVLGAMIDPAPWGTTYQWNYHNGGVAWAMQQLAELTGEAKYNEWAVDFCDFQMEGMPFVEYQVGVLHAYRSANAFVAGSTLLDFTLAPSLPLVHRLRTEPDFKNKEVYGSYIDNMIEYARHGQIRSEDMTNYTRTTPEEFTVWADDMFMGIPFLMQAGLYLGGERRKAFFDDAVGQLLDFDRHVWDREARLYMHANYSSRPWVKLPHWSRANGWAIWAMSEVLMYLPKDHPKYRQILKQFRTHAASLAEYQTSSGFWYNVIDRSDSPEEVSGTAIFTMAMARGVRYGWLDADEYTPIVMKGWEAVASEVEDDGTVHKICVGTMCSEDEEYYVARPFYDDDTHGSFAVIFAGMEVQKMIDSK